MAILFSLYILELWQVCIDIFLSTFSVAIILLKSQNPKIQQYKWSGSNLGYLQQIALQKWFKKWKSHKNQAGIQGTDSQPGILVWSSSLS